MPVEFAAGVRLSFALAHDIKMCHRLPHMSVEKHVTIKLRRAAAVRIKAELEKLGSMFITDWGDAISYMTAEEIIEAAGKAGTRKLHEWQARRDAGETFSAVSRSDDDDDERDTDDVTPEEIETAKRWSRMGRVHKAEAWKGKKK